MRRGILLLAGLSGCLVLLLTLGMQVIAQQSEPSEKPQADDRIVAGTPLAVVDLVSYEGPFWEDGSDREVVDIAALLVENRGDHFVERGAVILDWGQDRFIFEFSWLPPHSCSMVMESSAKPYCLPPDYEYYGWVELLDSGLSPITVTEEGMTMSLYNSANESIPAVTVRYKHYHAESSTYIGGITYSATVRELRPGESRSICPHHFSVQGSSIVYVEADRCETQRSANLYENFAVDMQICTGKINVQIRILMQQGMLAVEICMTVFQLWTYVGGNLKKCGNPR